MLRHEKIGMHPLIRVACVAVGSMVGTLAAEALLTALLGDLWQEKPAGPNVLAWMLLGHCLTAAALYFPVRLSRLAGRRLFAALFLACFGLGVILAQVEAAVFLEMSGREMAFTALLGTSSVLVAVVLAVWLYEPAPDGRPGGTTSMTLGSWSWRLAVADLCYVFLYFLAGALIYRFVQDYYASQDFDPGPWILPLQFFRGLMYMAFTVWLIRSLSGSRRAVALSMAFMFPVFAGVASLLVPNAIMPDHVRYWHTLEIGWSNFVFGGVVAALFWRRA
jgi:hypothetical protein